MTQPLRIMRDHASWYDRPAGAVRVLADDDGRQHLVVVTGTSVRIDSLVGQSEPPAPRVVDARDQPPFGVPDLDRALVSLGPVGRFSNASLWDALATAIIRQVVRAEQATKLYRRFSAAFGEPVMLADDNVNLFPGPEVVLSLTNEQFANTGTAFKRHALRAVAEAFLDDGRKWRQLDPPSLLTEVQRVPRIGAWTAHAAVADWSGDFAFYPYHDLAVRTWARRAAPTFPWPTHEAEFGQVWRRIAGDRLADLTLLTLAWGKHHGDLP